MARYERPIFRTKRGAVCDSGFEVTVLEDLDQRGVEYTYQPQPPLKYRSRTTKGICGGCGSREAYQERTYTPDIRLNDGTYVEIKGKFTGRNRSLMRAFIKCNPSVTLRVLFQRDNKFGKANSYVLWANAQGCDTATGTLPESWLRRNSGVTGEREDGGIRVCTEVVTTGPTRKSARRAKVLGTHVPTAPKLKRPSPEPGKRKRKAAGAGNVLVQGDYNE